MIRIAVLVIFGLLLGAGRAGAQTRFDLAAGAGSMAGGGPGAGGGLWPAVSATLMLNRTLGINTDFTTRSRGSLSFVPWLADISAAYRPLRANWGPEMDFGLGFETTSVAYESLPVPFGVNGLRDLVGVEFGPHFGLAAHLYISRRVFLRPEYHLDIFYPLGHPSYASYFGVMVGYAFR